MYDDWQPQKVDFETPLDSQDEKEENFNVSVNGNGEGSNTNKGNGKSNQRSNKNRNNKSKQYNNRSNSNNNSPEIDDILKEQAYNVVGSSINVLNELGTGLPLECYEKAMLTELKLKEIPYDQDQSHEIIYKEIIVGKCEIKLIAYDKINIWIIIDDNITDYHISSMLNHLKIAKLQAGLIFNFKYPKLQWQRVIAG